MIINDMLKRNSNQVSNFFYHEKYRGTLKTLATSYKNSSSKIILNFINNRVDYNADDVHVTSHKLYPVINFVNYRNGNIEIFVSLNLVKELRVRLRQ